MTPHTARPAPIATTSVCKMLIADVKNAIFNPETQIQNERNNTVLHNKKPPVSTDGTPFWLGYPFLFIFCFIFDGLYNGLFPALPRLRPDRRQKIFFVIRAILPPSPLCDTVSQTFPVPSQNRNRLFNTKAATQAIPIFNFKQ